MIELSAKYVSYILINHPSTIVLSSLLASNKDFLNVYKKVSKNKKYFFSIKDVILLETLSSDGFKMPKEFDKNPSLRNLTVPANINALVEKEEIGMLMLKLIEIIGTDVDNGHKVTHSIEGVEFSHY